MATYLQSPDGGAAETTSYEFDGNDRLTKVVYPAKTTSYSYDAAYNRLTERSLDNASQALLDDKGYHYNSRNQLTSITDNKESAQSVSYTFDANGNQTLKSKNGVITTFLYDVRDQLVSVQENATTLGMFYYDYQGMRVAKDMGGQIVHYTYDGKSVLTQSDVNGQTIAKYEYGPDQLLSMQHAAEGRQYYLFDALGSVSNLTNTSGLVQARYQYDAFGNLRAEAGSSFNRFTFTGHEKDTETGLYYFKARFYDPDTGRFLNQDPYLGDVNTPPSLHRYLYAYSNPVVYVDLYGYEATRWDSEDEIPHDTTYWAISRDGGKTYGYYNSDKSAYDTPESYASVAGMAGALGSKQSTKVDNRNLLDKAIDVYKDWFGDDEKTVTESESGTGAELDGNLAADRQRNIEQLWKRGKDAARSVAPTPEELRERANEGVAVVTIYAVSKIIEKTPAGKAVEKVGEELDKADEVLDNLNEITDYIRPEGSVRKQDYPTRVRKAKKAELDKKATGSDGLYRCQNADCDVDGGRVMRPEEGTVQHNPPLVETHNEHGYNADQKTRNNLYNDTATEIHCPQCQAKEGGETQTRYRRDVGPNYQPRKPRNKK